MPRKKEKREERSGERANIARAIAGDQLLQVVDLDRALYWLDRYGALVGDGEVTG